MTKFALISAALGAAFFCVIAPAMAQISSTRAVSTNAVTIGGSPVTVSAAHGRTLLELLNQHAANTVYCTLDGSTPVAAATANQITIPPLSGYIWSTGVIPSNGIQCVASGAGTVFTEIE